LYEKLWPKQKEAAEFVLGQPNAALFAEQGTGKTWITTGVIERLCEKWFQDILIVCPLSNLKTTWRATLEQLHDVAVYLDWPSFKKSKRNHKILLIHYEAMAKYDRQLSKHEWTLAVFDESQKLKSRGSRQSRIAGRIKTAHRRLILTGTPFDDLLDDPQEVWAQFRFVHPDLFGRRWRDFDERYLMPTGYMGYKRKFRRGMDKRVLKMVEPYCLRLVKSDVVDLPPLTYHEHRVTLIGEQRRLYKKLERDMVAMVNGEEVSAELTITLMIKLQQICGGFIKDDDDTIHQVGSAKIRKLRRLLNEVDRPVVIFCKYLEEIRQIEQAIPDNCRVSTIVGRTRKTRAATLEAFQQGQIDVLIAQIRTGGVGVDLQRSHVAIFYSATFSYIDFDQAVSRVHRAGQESPVEIHLIMARNSIDTLIYQALLYKRSAQDLILRQFRRSKRGDPIMAKKVAKKADVSKAETPKAETAKYGIGDLAEMLELTPASTRVKLRQNKIAKNGGRYGWNTKAELSEVADKLKTKVEKAKKED